MLLIILLLLILKLLSKETYTEKTNLSSFGFSEQISFDNFSNRKDAVVALRQLQASENKDAWIFVLE